MDTPIHTELAISHDILAMKYFIFAAMLEAPGTFYYN